MSREFGEYCNSGYFHEKIGGAAEDCRGGREPLTKLWGEFLEEFRGIAYAISSCEACDSLPDFPIIATLDRVPRLKRKLEEIENYVEPYRLVAEAAVRKAIEEGK